MPRERSAPKVEEDGSHKATPKKVRRDEGRYDEWEKLTPVQQETVLFMQEHSGPEATEEDMRLLARSKYKAAHELASRDSRTSEKDLAHLFEVGDVQTRKGVTWNKKLDADSLHRFAEAELARVLPSEDVLGNIIGHEHVSARTLSLIAESPTPNWLKILASRRVMERTSRNSEFEALRRKNGM